LRLVTMKFLDVDDDDDDLLEFVSSLVASI